MLFGAHSQAVAREPPKSVSAKLRALRVSALRFAIQAQE